MITMTGFNQQKRIDALKEALSHLNKICDIVYEQEPTATEVNLFPTIIEIGLRLNRTAVIY